jgi:D-psicose/D-tagatose/L-ribulose 3-epimerase
MPRLQYAVHAYAWTNRWTAKDESLIDHSKELGFDVIEIPLMDLDEIHPASIRARLSKNELGVVTSTALPLDADITSDDPAIRESGLAYLKACIDRTSDMGGKVFTGVIYSAIGRKIDGFPTEAHYTWAAEALAKAARHGAKAGVTLGIEPVNRYETFLVNTAQQALDLKRRAGEANIAVHLDAYHMNIEENGFYEPVRAAAPELCHFHMSESHRGTPGTGTVDWQAIYRGLHDGGYTGLVGLESFIEVADSMRAATCVWRKMAPSSDELLTRGLAFLKAMEKKVFE